MDCYLHVGTHKTGTTALQRYFGRHDRRLAQIGLYYPRAGRQTPEYPGHHNLAFELNGDPRFVVHGVGGLADLEAELAHARPHRVCISSEALSFLEHKPAALRLLRETFEGIGYRVRVLVYLREQSEYAESLYAEMVKQGMTLTFRTFLEIVLASGAFSRDAHRSYTFRYTELLERFAAVFGEDAVQARAYCHADDAWIVRDALVAMGLDGAWIHRLDPNVARDNPRLGLHGVLRERLANLAAARPLTGAERSFIAALPPPGTPDQPFAPLANGEAARVSQRFVLDNARLAARWRVRIPRRERAYSPLLEQDRGASALFTRAEQLFAG